jgi:dTDP-4-amino-4,6-dideoxygalactose transaminase
LGGEEFKELFRHRPAAVHRFEEEFARVLQTRHALAFPYGRSALWTFFKAVGLQAAEIILPAYTCSVVAHAVVLSGNIPKFVDISLSDYNMDLDMLSKAINERTKVVIATHLFGYPLNVDHLEDIIRASEAKYGNKIWVIQDCAHAFGARWRGKLVCNSGDAAIFGLNISKLITSIFGGMLTTNNTALAERIRIWRDEHFRLPSPMKTLRRQFYLLAVYAAFTQQICRLVNFLEEKTTLLDSLTKAYHLDNKVRFPPNYDELMTAVEARVGLAQLRKYPEIIRRRKEVARYYHEQLQGRPGWALPPLIQGATYSHYVILVPDRVKVIQKMAEKGIQIGKLIEYCLPHRDAYNFFGEGKPFPNALMCSQHAINLPLHTKLTLPS